MSLWQISLLFVSSIHAYEVWYLFVQLELFWDHHSCWLCTETSSPSLPAQGKYYTYPYIAIFLEISVPLLNHGQSFAVFSTKEITVQNVFLPSFFCYFSRNFICLCYINLWLGYVQYFCYLTRNLITQLTEYICNIAVETHIKVLLWSVTGASRGKSESTEKSASVLNARPTDYEIKREDS